MEITQTTENEIRAVITPKFDIERTIKQSNRLVEAKYYLTQMEQRFILLFIAHLPQDASDLVDVTLPLADVMQGMGYTDGGNKYERLYEILDNIMLKVLTIRSHTNSGTWYKTHWVQSIYYDADNHTITVGFDARLKNDLLQLHKAYVSTSAILIISFKGKYTARIYLLIKQYLTAGERIMQIDWIRQTLQLTKAYSQIHRVEDLIQYTINQINDRSDITCDFEYLKTGRKITALRVYNIKEKAISSGHGGNTDGGRANIELTAEDAEIYKLITRAKWGINSNVAYRLIAKYGAKRIYRNLLYCDKTRQNKYNLAGYLFRAIKDDYAADLERRRREEEHEREKQRERSNSVNKPIIGGQSALGLWQIPEKSEAEKAEEEKYSRELRPLEISLIKKNGENVSHGIKRRLNKLGLTVADVLAGRVSKNDSAD